ncbi:hypothetical protein P3T43_007052 [Paraburkholderia sp. GAS41]
MKTAAIVAVLSCLTISLAASAQDQEVSPAKMT